ncbi:MAG TPA: trigger factor [Patescibacteria group bacterium]|nr:trigger factor [Patescibacteria group bacterium]
MTDIKPTATTKITSVIARETDGNVQITFTIPYSIIKHAQEETVVEMAKDIEIPGFRKGMAPLSKVMEKIPQSSLIEHSLSHVLPNALAEAITENKLKIAIYPKFELISAETDKDWQIKGVTCELPEFSLGDYKKAIQGEMRSKSIIVPGNAKPEDIAKTPEEKESLVIKAIIESVKITIPKILIEEEVASRLSTLLSRIEKLGLALEGYLASIGKNVDSLRSEYETQAKDAIALDLILTKVAMEENLKVSEAEIAAALNMSTATTNARVEDKEDLESRKRMIESILKRRQALDYLTSLA